MAISLCHWTGRAATDRSVECPRRNLPDRGARFSSKRTLYANRFRTRVRENSPGRVIGPNSLPIRRRPFFRRSRDNRRRAVSPRVVRPKQRPSYACRQFNAPFYNHLRRVCNEIGARGTTAEGFSKSLGTAKIVRETWGGGGSTFNRYNRARHRSPSCSAAFTRRISGTLIKSTPFPLAGGFDYTGRRRRPTIVFYATPEISFGRSLRNYSRRNKYRTRRTVSGRCCSISNFGQIFHVPDVH